MLQQFNALAQLRRVDQLTIDPQGNPVVNFTLWKYYVLFRLSHFSMQRINGTEVRYAWGTAAKVVGEIVRFSKIVKYNHDRTLEKYCILYRELDIPNMKKLKVLPKIF